jgi:hypothetical protein
MRITIFGRRDSADGVDAPLSVSGDARIAGAAAFPSGLVANDGLTVGSGARIVGNLRVAGTLALEADARVTGDVTVEGDVFIASGAGVDGRLVCRRVRLGTRAAAGDDEPVTAREDAPVTQAPVA